VEKSAKTKKKFDKEGRTKGEAKREGRDKGGKGRWKTPRYQKTIQKRGSILKGKPEKGGRRREKGRGAA